MPAKQQSNPESAPDRKSTGGDSTRAGRELGALWAMGIGNRALGGLFKERIGAPNDPFEREADRAAATVSHGGALTGLLGGFTPGAGSIQRKCAACEEKQEEKIRRAPKEGEAEASEAQAEPETPAAKPEQEAAAPAEAQPAAQAKGAPALLVEDGAEAGPGQMRRGEFMNALRAEVCATADEALAASGSDTKGCPWVDYWFGYYEGQDAAHVERALRRYAPEAAGATSAAEYTKIVTARVRRSVDVWAKTGQVTGVPEEAAAGAGGGVLDSFGGMFFKARPGEARHADPVSVRDQLGGGQPLAGAVRTRMESAFGANFGSVRLHADAKGAELSDRLNARAFTVGQHVAFGAREFSPGTIAGDALIAHELAHVVQQGGATAPVGMGKSPAGDVALEVDADRSAIAAISSLWTHLSGTAVPLIKSGLRLQRCGKSERQKEIDRLGAVQYGFMEDKRKKEQERLKKEAEEDAKKKGLKPPKDEPKVEMGDVIKKDVEKHALKGSPTTEWDTADQPKWKKDAADAWTAVVASVKGTELESVAKGVTFNFDPKAALEGGFYAAQKDHTLTVGMSWVRFAKQDPKNVWENLAHEMAGHFEYGETYLKEIMESALSRLSSDERKRFKGDPQKFFETYEYPETEIYASLWQRRYRVPVAGAERPSGGIHPDLNIVNKLNVMKDTLDPEVAKAVLKELKRRVDANAQILQRDKDFLVEKVKEVFGYSL